MAITDIAYDRQRYTFDEKFDLPPRLVASANRFKQLKGLENPTSDEVAELASLTTVLAQYTMSAVEWNNLFKCMGNMQDFLVYDVKAWLNNNKTDMSNAVDESINNIDNKVDEVNRWWAQIKGSISANTTFDFDSVISISGDFKKTTTVSQSGNTHSISEVISINNLTFATRTTTVNSSTNTISERIIVYDGAGSTDKVYDKTTNTTISNNTFTSNTVSNI